MAKNKRAEQKKQPVLRITPAAEGHNGAYDQDVDPAPPRRKKQGASLGYTLAMVFFAAVFLVSAGMLLMRFWNDRQAENEFSSLESLIDTAVPAAAAGGDETAGTSGETNAEKFARLKAKNADFAGWLSIAGTNLNFPVMLRPDTRDFYLRHDFNGEYSVYGVPYLDETCTLSPASSNLIIYGHNMKTGIIFGCLTEYKKADYYKEHPVIQFDTLYGDGRYEVWGAFAIDVVNDPSFAYNSYIDMGEAAFNEFVGQVKARSDVDSGITPVYGDALLTLSTCEYSTSNGRYVVCARRVG